MPVPSTQEIRKPLLEAFRGEAPRNFATNELLELIADRFGSDVNDMSSADKNLLKSGINDAKSYLKRNGLMSNPSGSTYMITKKGRKALAGNPDIIDDEYLAGINAPKIMILPPVEPEPEPEPEMIPDPEPEPEQEPEAPAVPDIEPEPMPEEPEPEPEPQQEAEPEAEEIPDPEPEPEADPEPETEEPEMPEELPEPEPEVMPEPEPEQEPEPEPEPEIEPEEYAEPEMTEHEEHEEEPEDIYEPEDPEPEPEQESEPGSEPDSYTEPEPEQDMNDDMNDYAVMPSQGIEDVLARYNADLADEVLMKTASIPSDMFEMLVIDLLSKMGYHAFQNARYTSESSGSEYIQGVILEDKPGLPPVYVHAHKLSPGRTIGKAEIRDFADAIADKGGKGIFATTANFSENAVIAANDERIMLIDGARLAGLMISHNFCVSVEKVFEVKAVDPESFSEYEA